MRRPSPSEGMYALRKYEQRRANEAQKEAIGPPFKRFAEANAAYNDLVTTLREGKPWRGKFREELIREWNESRDQYWFALARSQNQAGTARSALDGLRGLAWIGKIEREISEEHGLPIPPDSFEQIGQPARSWFA